MEGHETALHIIETHREQHKQIAEALLKYETLDEKQILSLYKTGKVPDKDVAAEDEEARAQTFEESKRELERLENERHDEAKSDKADSDTSNDDSTNSQSSDDSDNSEDK